MKPRMSRQKAYTEKDISEFHWTNGLPPTEDESPEWLQYRDNDWQGWSLQAGDKLNDRSVELSLADLRELPKTEYIAGHTCMPGWSATSKWRGGRWRAQ